MRKGGATRSKAQYERDIFELSRMYCEGIPQWKMAETLHLSPRQIAYDLVALRKRWFESGVVNFDERRAREVANWDNLERTYWAAWERSLQQRVIKQAKRGKDKEEQSLRQEERDGNPAYLAGVERCIANRCELLGLIVKKSETKNVELTHEEWLRECEAERECNAKESGSL
jgi:hypothetical protein